MKTLVRLLALTLFTAGTALADVYKFDPVHTQVTFYISHAGFSNSSGRFHIAGGTLNYDGKDWSKATVQATINTSTLDMGDATWKEHVSDNRFLDVAKFPTIEFKSNKVEVVSADQLRVSGDLTIHGVTKPVVLDAHINKAGPHPFTRLQSVGFTATTRVKRSEFGIMTYLPAIADDVDIRLEIEAGVPKA